MKFTKAAIEGLQLPDGKAELIAFDDLLPGFGVRIRRGGRRTWIAQYRLGHKQRRLTLGTLQTLDIDAARRLAKSALAKAHLGLDPQHDKQQARTHASVTLDLIADKYLSTYAARNLRPSTLAEVARYLHHHWAPLGDRPIRALSRSETASRLSEIAAQSGLFAANRARAALSSLYAWAIAEGLADINPVLGTRKATDERPRDRVLQDSELAIVWKAADSGDYGDIIRLLILTGQRREEVAGMRWDELDLVSGQWRIGADRTKNARAHEVPLTDAILQILQRRTRQDGRDLVFGLRGPFSGWSKAKHNLDSRIEAASKTRLSPWRLHDLRRTVATRLADFGVLPHIIEAILNHASGHKAGVAGVYNRSSYAAEKRAAIAGWTRHVHSLLQP